jgi:hypothetical protein
MKRCRTTPTRDALELEIIQEDIEHAERCVSAFDLTQSGLRPSQLASPFTTAYLRMRPDGFLLSTGEDEITIIPGPKADMLRNVFQRFISQQSTSQQFVDDALPLILELRKDAA